VILREQRVITINIGLFLRSGPLYSTVPRLMIISQVVPISRKVYVLLTMAPRYVQKILEFSQRENPRKSIS
jgi:hypothetical protein